MILALKTTGETSELYLLDDASSNSVKSEVGDGFLVAREEKWQAGRELGKTLLGKIEQFLADKSFKGISGLIVFSGPGSFTGLRIGITTMNAIAYSESIPIVGVGGDNWLKDGVEKLENSENNRIVIPNYGAEPNITIKKR